MGYITHFEWRITVFFTSYHCIVRPQILIRPIRKPSLQPLGCSFLAIIMRIKIPLGQYRLN